MSRWPNEFERSFLRHEAEQRFVRIEEVMAKRRREYELSRPLPEPIVDRDPGDEDANQW